MTGDNNAGFDRRPQYRVSDGLRGLAALLRSSCGGRPVVTEPNDFVAWMRPLSVHGLTAVALKFKCGFAGADRGRSIYRYERTRRDAWLAGVDAYCALFQVASRRAVIQNDQAVLAEGDIALVDGARPATYVSENGRAQWLALYLPRQLLVSHLGFEPQGVLFGSGGTRAARLVQDPENGDASASSVTDPYMQMTVYDLLGALFGRDKAVKTANRVVPRIAEVRPAPLF